MPQTLFTADWLVLSYQPETGVLQQTYKRTPNSQEYRHGNEIALGWQGTHKAEALLLDLREQGLIAKEDRQWLEAAIMPHMVGHGLRRVALVTTEDVFKKYYVHRLNQVSGRVGLQIRHFLLIEEAMYWLLKPE